MRIVFMGTPESAVPSLRQLLDDNHEIIAVWTQPDKPAGRGNKLHQSPVKEFALGHNLTVQQPAKIKTDEAKALFASHNADAAIVVAYGRILPAEFLSAPERGCINVHFSLLPKYRGAAPVNWAIINGEVETGVTPMMKREDGLINWSMDAYDIERRVRGFQPWPNAYTSFGSQRLIIWKAAPEWIEQLTFPPGQVIEARGDRLLIACGDGTALRVSELQTESGPRLSARDLLNGMHLKMGEFLGPNGS